MARFREVLAPNTTEKHIECCTVTFTHSHSFTSGHHKDGARPHFAELLVVGSNATRNFDVYVRVLWHIDLETNEEYSFCYVIGE
jgi:hypothetical protein